MHRPKYDRAARQRQPKYDRAAQRWRCAGQTKILRRSEEMGPPNERMSSFGEGAPQKWIEHHIRRKKLKIEEG